MKFGRLSMALAVTVSLGVLAFLPASASAATTYSETTGGVANTWTNYTNAGGYAGPQIGAYATIQIACKVHGFRVADGNTWWYLIASAPWSYRYYVSADPFYNNGQTSGSLLGTPFVDPAVPDCASGSGVTETTGGVANTWTDHTNAGGTAGPQIPAYTSVQIACKLQGFRVANGNTWWYRIASAPWNNAFYVSADVFYNNGATSGSLLGTPYVDPAVPDCAGSSGGSTISPTVTLAQGPAASVGYRYAISLAGFAPFTAVSLMCYDSVSPGGFYQPFNVTTNSSGSGFTQAYCFSGEGPDHWVIANGRFESNHVSWGASSGGSGTGGGGTPAPSLPPPPPASQTPKPTGGISLVPPTASPMAKQWPNLAYVLDSRVVMNACYYLMITRRPISQRMCYHYGEATGRPWAINMSDLIWAQRPLWALLEWHLRNEVASKYAALSKTPSNGSYSLPFRTGWRGYTAATGDWSFALHGISFQVGGDVWIGPANAAGVRPVQIRYRSNMFDIYDFDRNGDLKSRALWMAAAHGWAAEYLVVGGTRTITHNTASNVVTPWSLPFTW